MFTSEDQIKEIVRVVERPKFNKYFSEDDIIELIILLEYFCINVVVENKINDCRDSKDNYLLETGLNGDVDYLVTGDNDLLEMNPYRGLKIINLKEFEDILSEINNL